jgi:hypothetical protein
MSPRTLGFLFRRRECGCVSSAGAPRLSVQFYSILGSSAADKGRGLSQPTADHARLPGGPGGVARAYRRVEVAFEGAALARCHPGDPLARVALQLIFEQTGELDVVQDKFLTQNG